MNIFNINKYNFKISKLKSEIRTINEYLDNTNNRNKKDGLFNYTIINKRNDLLNDIIMEYEINTDFKEKIIDLRVELLRLERLKIEDNMIYKYTLVFISLLGIFDIILFVKDLV